MSYLLSLALVISLLFPLPAAVVATTPTGTGHGADLQSIIDAALPGAVVEIQPGTYYGSLVVDKSLHLLGITGADGSRTIVNGEGTGTVLTITASDVVVENLIIQNSGNVIDHEDGGIVINRATDVQIIGNHLDNVLYGVRGIEAHRLAIRNNYITGKDLDIARRGDGIRLWQSEDCFVEGNVVERVRDAIFWFSDGTTVRDNIFRANRYGVHMMYTDGMTVEGNTMIDNSVGAYLMYSIKVTVANNLFQRNRGPSGYGLALKDMDGVAVHENYYIDNRVGLFFDNSPARVDIEQTITSNVFAYNDTGVLMMPAVQRNKLHRNTFLDNLEQVGVKGGGSQQGDQLGGNGWNGNFWSDYTGYDQAEDGTGDFPYRAESLFESLADTYPNLQLFHFSPVEQTIDLAARAFPVIKPKPKLTDNAPMMAPILPSLPHTPAQSNNHMGGLAVGLLLGALFAWSNELRRYMIGRHPRKEQDDPLSDTHSASSSALDFLQTTEKHVEIPTMNVTRNETILTVNHLMKRYPRPGRPWWSDDTVIAVDDLSFQLKPGEALALWGTNGAGKTTVLKCLLGLLRCEGELLLNGYDLKHKGRKARFHLGYVPQELAFHADMTVIDTCYFYARLKNVPIPQTVAALEQVGLEAQSEKAVGALSGGMKQRLALALALLADPPVLLLDEPTSNLDAATRTEFLEMLLELRQTGKSLLFTSHHLIEVEQLADRVLILHDGRQTAQGPTVDLMHQLAPDARTIRHIKLHVPSQQRSLAQQVLIAGGYATSPNGTGLWVEVADGQKAKPLGLLYNADIDVIDVDL